MAPLNKPVNYDQLFPGRFLKAGLFMPTFGTNKPLVTIKDYDLEELPQDDGNEKARGVITLVETKMQIALNRTNGECLKAMFGPSLRNWVSKRVVLCVERDRDPGGPKGATCDAIRVFGSPDIAEDMSVQIKLPKRRPYTRNLVAVRLQQPPIKENASAPVKQEKPAGNIDEAKNLIHTTGEEGMTALRAKLNGYSWTKDEIEQIKLAFENP